MADTPVAAPGPVALKKIIYLDCETTGLDPKVNGIIQISGIIEVSGVVKESFDFKVRPFDTDVIDAKALEINGKTEVEVKAYKTPQIVHQALTKLLGKHVDKYDRTDKFLMVGYNAQFDQRMLKEWFEKLGDKYYFSWISPQVIDVYSLAGFFRYFAKIDTENLKQITVAKFFGITYDAHDAYSDVKVCRQLFHQFASMLG